MSSAIADPLTFGVPWSRLAESLERIKHVYAPRPRNSQVWPAIFFCGLKYGGSYGAIHKQQVVHDCDDGLRESVHEALPILMRATAVDGPRPAKAERVIQQSNAPDFHRFCSGFIMFESLLPESVTDWLGGKEKERRSVRLVFGMGAVAFSDSSSRERVIALVKGPLPFPHRVHAITSRFAHGGSGDMAESEQ